MSNGINEVTFTKLEAKVENLETDMEEVKYTQRHMPSHIYKRVDEKIAAAINSAALKFAVYMGSIMALIEVLKKFIT